jgi:hypothetical protein
MSENQKGHKYQLGINSFSDMSPDEFAETHFGYKRPEKPFGDSKHLGTHVYDGAPLADSIDWVSRGAVTDVKKPGSVWLLLGLLHHWGFGRCLADRHKAVGVHERAESCRLLQGKQWLPRW